jgi:riboflavin synthase
MFTGLVAECAQVTALEQLPDESVRLTVHTNMAPAIGDSMSVNGVCLTVERYESDAITMLAMRETLRRTTVGSLVVGSRVNLEPALTLHAPLGGHIVQGHVDSVGTIVSREPSAHWDNVRIHAPAEVARYLVLKGSIAVDGVSLTISGLDDQPDGTAIFTVSLIPVTLDNTTMGAKQVGESVNLEVDILAKYVERLISTN